MNVRWTIAGVVAMLAALPHPAQARWREASSDHFVIYADEAESRLRRFAEVLERYHAAMEVATGWHQPPPSPSNRVTIYVVGSERAVRELAGADKFVAGFYIPRAGGSRAYVQDIEGFQTEPSWSVTVLLHEYAHHFLMSGSRFAMPRWMNEGAAEFYASAEFSRDGAVGIGRPARHRAGELFNARDVGVRELFDADLYAENRGRRYDAYYGRAWLLYHYLFFNRDRAGQMQAYAAALANGAPPLEAARGAFGDLDVLQQEVDDYLHVRRMHTLDIAAEHLPAPVVKVRELSEGFADAIPLQIRSQRGVDEDTAADILVDARDLAARYPDEPHVLAELAEAENDARNRDRAIAAADRAMAIDPTLTNPYVQKGYALFAKAREAGTEAAWDAALQPWIALNRMENDHPLPLIYFYRIKRARNGETGALAHHALERAAQLAPFDLGLAFETGLMQAGEGKIALARRTIGPVATNPHGGELARHAQDVLSLLDHAEEGAPFTAPPMMDSPTEFPAGVPRSDGESDGAGSDGAGNDGAGEDGGGEDGGA